MPWWRNEYYSQFGEDSVIHGFFRSKAYGASRDLNNIGDGFFVDIGCHHPFMLSNTWFFYQRGWRGVNIDPTPGTEAEFRAHRPEDTTLEIAISDHDGQATLVHYGRNVMNTLETARVRKDVEHETITVPTLKLSTLLDRHLPESREISFLSVDVEGHDLVVLKSNDWSRYRPELVVTELHERDMGAILASEIHNAMTGWGYKLYAWTPPSLIYRRS